MNTSPVYLHLATLTAPKTSLNAHGGIVYALLKDEAATEVFFTLLENQGGSGYFGREIIPFDRIAACLTGADLTQPLAAKRFLKAFCASKSVNNGGFLCACLRHQGLLKPAPDASHQHVIGEDWDAWKARMLATTSAEVFSVAQADDATKGTPPQSGADATPPKKPGGKDKKGAAASVSTEGKGHARPA